MEKLAIIYLGIGCLLGLILEITWPLVYPEEEIHTFHRLLAVFGWPVVIISAIGHLALENNNENDNDNQSDDGLQSGWGY